MVNQHPFIVTLALGSNQGDRLAALRAAKAALAGVVDITATSWIYETPPAYVTDQPPFLNAALVGMTRLTPDALLIKLKEIERDVGRTPTFHYGPRVIDLDIIFYSALVLDGPALTIPHPRMAERAFVLKPLADVASDWVHPVSGQSVSMLLAQLPDADSAVSIHERL
jgi:2-amino-4-hydroxy-6-hydroxymethyldihydropteridine diphosphokinase